MKKRGARAIAVLMKRRSIVVGSISFALWFVQCSEGQSGEGLLASGGADATVEASATPDSTTAPPEDASTDADGASARAPQVCRVVCTNKADCALNGGGECTNGVCVLSANGADACAVDADCVPYGSSFEIRTKCTSMANCSSTEACIAWNGKGVCQPVPGPSRPCSEFLGMVDLPWKDIDGNTITICGRNSYVCDGTCRAGCTADSGCSGSTPVCDVPHHRCVCSANSCAGGTFNGEVCLPSGRCGCHGNDDCKVTQGFDQCFGDTCGCSGNGACAGIVQGAALVCVTR